MGMGQSCLPEGGECVLSITTYWGGLCILLDHTLTTYWYLLLHLFKLTLVHRPSVQMMVDDMLSLRQEVLVCSSCECGTALGGNYLGTI